METRSPLPPFTHESAIEKVRMAEDAWNSRDPDRVVLVYSEDTRWRNRDEVPVGRPEGFMVRRYASINDLPITDAQREFHWQLGRRPDDHASLSDLDL